MTGRHHAARVRRLLTAALLGPVLAACGSTVEAGQQATGGGGLSYAGGAAGTNSGGAPSSTGNGAGFAPGAVGAPGGPSYVGNGTAPGASGTSTVGGTNPSQGATSAGGHDTSAIRVGFELIQGGNQIVAQGLGTPVNFGDGKAEVTGIVNDINKHGGINGRHIQPYFGNWNAASGDNGRQADCTQLTEDDHVSFIITVVNMSAEYVACAAQHHVPIINASFGAGDDYMYRQFPLYLYTASLMSLNKEEQLVLTTGRGSGRVSTSRRVGVVIDNTPPGDPQYDRVLNATVAPTLKAWGIPYETFSVATQGDVNNAVLRFRADGVKTVVFIAPSGIIEILFMQAAEQQQWRPDYILGDSTDPWFIGEAAPTAQVQHITGAGSLPVSNVPESQYPTTAREKQCFAVIRAAGETNTNRHSSLTATPYCEATWEFVAVASKVVGALTPVSYFNAYSQVGTSFDPVTTFAINFANGRHTGAARYRTLGYASQCQCITYTSGLRPIP